MDKKGNFFYKKPEDAEADSENNYLSPGNIPCYIYNDSSSFVMQNSAAKDQNNEEKNSAVLSFAEPDSKKPQFRRIDFLFSEIHGSFGEDGKLQGWFEVLNCPYSGSGVLASAAAMDKSIAKKIAKAHNLSQVKYLEFLFLIFSRNLHLL